MDGWSAMLLLGSLLSGSPRSAETFVFVHEQIGNVSSRGLDRFVTPVDGTFEGSPVVGGPSGRCDDDDACTDDSRDPSTGACRNVPIAGSCWSVVGITVATATARGRMARKKMPFVGTLIMRDDGTYEIPSSACPSAGTALPGEFGIWREGRRGRVVLEVANLDEQVTALRACTALPSFAIKETKGFRRWVKIRSGGGRFCRWGRIPADGDHLCGFTKLRGHVRVNGQLVRLRLTERYTGTRAGALFAIGNGGLRLVVPRPRSDLAQPRCGR